jgi:hypothetical protein
MTSHRKGVKAGDVLLLKVGDAFAYLHYIGPHPEYGDAIVVGSKVRERQAVVHGEMFSSGYVAFYPLRAAVAQGLVEIVGYEPPPSLPARLRRPGARSGRRVDTWIIENDTGEAVKTKLSEEELQLPIAVIWNHELLVQRITEGWHPTQEGKWATTNGRLPS